jgi:hypothetical protein
MRARDVAGCTIAIVLGVLTPAYALLGAPQSVTRPTSALAIAGPQQPSMGVPHVSPIWPDTANPTGVLELTCPRGCVWYPPPQVKVLVRLPTGSVWREQSGKVIVVPPRNHVRVMQR